MNKNVDKFLLTEHKLMHKLHLRQVGFTYSGYEPSTKHRERIQKFRETGNLKHLLRSELDKYVFAHHATCFDSQDLAKRIVLDKIFKDKAY